MFNCLLEAAKNISMRRVSVSTEGRPRRSQRSAALPHAAKKYLDLVMAIHACNIAFVIAFAFVTHFTIPNTTCCAFAMSSSMIVTIPQSAFATI